MFIEINDGGWEEQGSRTRTTNREVPSTIYKMAPECRASGKGKRQQEECIHAAWKWRMIVRDTWKEERVREAKDGLSNGTDIETNIGIDKILECVLLDYNTGILENWKIIGLDIENIVARVDGEDKNGTKSQRGVNMDQEDKELDGESCHE